MRYFWLKYVRPIVWPWYMERDTDAGFRRWLRETENGKAGYRQFRAAAIALSPESADEWPDQLDYGKE